MPEPIKIQSDNVQVFPSTRRSNYQVSARLMSESSFANIVNRLIDTEGFVITSDEDVAASQASSPTTTVFEFNIHGYYFKISDVPELFNEFSSATSVYAAITLDVPSVDSIYYELQGQDNVVGNVSLYSGVQFYSSAVTGTNIYCLKLFERQATSSAWLVPQDSRIKFRLGVQGIDGGEIIVS